MSENASAATRRIIPSLPRAHLEHAELALGFVDGDLGRAHLAVLDGEIERPLLRPAGGAVRAQQEVQPAQDEYDHRDQDQASSQCASILREVSSLSSSRSRPDCSGGTPPQRLSRRRLTYLIRP